MARTEGALPPGIVYVLDFLPTYVVREAAGIIAAGFSVGIHLPVSGLSNGLWEKVVEGTGLPDPSIVRTDVRKDWCSLPAGRLLLQAAPVILRHLLATPIRFIRLACASLREGTFRYFLAGAGLAAGLRRAGPALLHSHFATDAAHTARWAAALLGVPFTVTTHAADIFCPERPERVRTLLAAADGIHTISAFNAAFMAERYGEALRDRIVVSVLGLDPGTLPARPPSEPRKVPEFVCSASGLVPKKGVEILLGACRILLDRGLRFTCTIVGADAGEARLASLRRRILEAGLAGQVSLAGLLPSSAALERVAAGTVFVLPCVQAPGGDMDGIPVSLMESMAMGIPSISTRLSGIPELIEDGVSGLLVEPGDPAALADAMERLVTDPGLAARLGAAGRMRTAADFSLDRHVRGLVSFWNGRIASFEGGRRGGGSVRGVPGA